jgi:hypothetical protein
LRLADGGGFNLLQRLVIEVARRAFRDEHLYNFFVIGLDRASEDGTGSLEAIRLCQHENVAVGPAGPVRAVYFRAGAQQRFQYVRPLRAVVTFASHGLGGVAAVVQGEVKNSEGQEQLHVLFAAVDARPDETVSQAT